MPSLLLSASCFSAHFGGPSASSPSVPSSPCRSDSSNKNSSASNSLIRSSISPGSYFRITLCIAASAAGRCACTAGVRGGLCCRISNRFFRIPNILSIIFRADAWRRLKSSCALVGLI
ncbi:hypothetical protein L208DRAFT_1490082, partial [Tricholoma matsutake]